MPFRGSNYLNLEGATVERERNGNGRERYEVAGPHEMVDPCGMAGPHEMADPRGIAGPHEMAGPCGGAGFNQMV